MKLHPLIIAVGVLAANPAAWAQPKSYPLAPPTGTKLYVVQLSDAPIATYRGSVRGLAPTQAQPGTRLDSQSTAARQYDSYLSQRRSAVLASLGNVRPVYTYNTSLNGFAARLTELQVRALRGRGDVAAVHESKSYKLATTHTPEFLGLSKPGGLWSSLDSKASAVKGEGVIVGVIDSGVWPESAAFGDKVDAQGRPVPYYASGTPAYFALPAKWKGICQTGPGFTAAMCNNKLIGARFYLDGFLEQVRPYGADVTTAPMEYHSPRAASSGAGGHGTHTASTAAGNQGVELVVGGTSAGAASGMAPRARIAVYKACWEGQPSDFSSCSLADLVKAIDDAVKDGVDVINFSVSGTPYAFSDPAETAFLNASAAGVFVAAAAGNSGPSQSLSHPSPWLTTVAASTHDRYQLASLTLGNGAVYSGPSFQTTGIPKSPLVLARDVGVKPFDQLTQAEQWALELCFKDEDRAAQGVGPNAALSKEKAAGRIVVCQRGTSALVNKADAVKEAGGAGMVLLNTPETADNQYALPFSVPTVHLKLAALGPVTAYAASANASAVMGPGLQQAGVVAPMVADFSSRGPSFGNDNILKPDIAAPGVAILASWPDSSLTQATRDAVAANTLIPKAIGYSSDGTSMASPHVAGIAALLKQLHPTWSPAAIKSAIVTTAGPVYLQSGAADPDRAGYGAGNVNPNKAADPGLVYDIATVDYVRFLCGVGLTPPPGHGTCGETGSIKASDLNLPTLTASEVRGTQTLTRTVTNVSKATSTYTVSTNLPGWTVSVNPKTLTLAPGASASFAVRISPDTTAVGVWTYGTLVWSNGSNSVVSPLSAKAAPFLFPKSMWDLRSRGKGSLAFQVTANYTGALQVQNTGLIAATTSFDDTMLPYFGMCQNVVVPENTEMLSVRLFEEDVKLTQKTLTGLDMQLLDGPNATGFPVAQSVSYGNNEEMSLMKPRAGTYSACVFDFAYPALAGSTFKWNFFVMAPGVPKIPMRATGPTSVFRGGNASIAAGWDVPPNQRYVGAIKLLDPASKEVGTTQILINTKAAP